MRLPRTILLAWAGWALPVCTGMGQVETAPLGPEPVGRAVSADKQFVVYADELKARASFVEFAERVKTDYLTLLSRSPDWVFPIVIQVNKETERGGEAGAPNVQQRLFETGDGYRLQVDVVLGKAFRSEDLRSTLLAMLMLEQALRQEEGEPPPQLLPRWLKEGLPEAIGFRQQGEPSTLFASIFKGGQVLSVEQLLESTVPEENSVSEAIYRASACGFIHLLLDQPGGSAHLSELIGSLAYPAASMADRVARHFPGLRGTTEKMEKWWALQASTLARPGVFELMSAEETDQAIEAALQLRFWETAPAAEGEDDVRAAAAPARRRPRLAFWRRKEAPAEEAAAVEAAAAAVEAAPAKVEVVCGLRDFDRYIRREDRVRILAPAKRRLTELALRSFPLHRPLLEEYRAVVRELEEGKVGGLDLRLEALAWERQSILGRMQEVRDYVNWWSVTQAEDKSGAFDRYLRRSREWTEDESRRPDRVSRYLDGMVEELQ